MEFGASKEIHRLGTKQEKKKKEKRERKKEFIDLRWLNHEFSVHLIFSPRSAMIHKCTKYRVVWDSSQD